MRYRRFSASLLLTGFACLCLLRPVFAAAQETTSVMPEFINYMKAQTIVEVPLAPPAHPPGDSAFLQPDGGGSDANRDVGAASDEPFTIQLGHKRLNSSMSFLYSAPGNDYLGRPGNQITGAWQSSLIGGIAFDLGKRNATAFQLNSDVEIYGPVQQLSDRQQPSGQDLTFDFGLVQLFPLNKAFMRSFTLEVGGYQQWLVSQPLFASGPVAVREPGYTVSSTGLQVEITLPEHNMTLSLRYGTERLARAWQKPNAVELQFSWTW
jgi:hypothetical protein